MIVRVWKARATLEKAPAYRAHLETHVFPVLRSVPGFINARLWQRRDAEEIEFVVTSRWASLEAVRSFAGDTYENAVIWPSAKAVLSSYDDRVEHYEVVAECDA